MNKAYKVRIYPNKEQETQINKTLGSCRALYNMMLYERKEVYEKLKDNKRELYEYKYKTEKEYKEEFEWMKEADSVALQQSRIDLSNAYSNFFKSLSGKRKGQSGFPKFKKKKNGSSYRTIYPQGIKVSFEDKKIKLPKLGWIKFRNGRANPEGIIKNATVSRTSSGKYFVSVLYECSDSEIKDVKLKSNPKVKGLDMSLEHFYVDELGQSPDYERLYRKNENRLKLLQKQLARKKQGSKNWYKQVRRIALLHEKIKNKRNDFTQKLSKSLVEENDVIVVESLSLKGMSQALYLGKSVMDLGYSEFIRQLQYKSLWNGKILIQADKFFASSKTCSLCGFIKKDLKLSEREWVCPNCGKFHYRDQNAGINLAQLGYDFLIGVGDPEFKLVENETAV